MNIASFKIITPESGDWLVIEDVDSGAVVYSGHGSGDELWAVLDYLRVNYNYEELPDDEYEEKYA